MELHRQYRSHLDRTDPGTRYARRDRAWSYRQAYPEVGRISDLVSFEPDIVSVQLDGAQLRLEPGQTVIPHGPDRGLTVDEALHRKQP